MPVGCQVAEGLATDLEHPQESCGSTLSQRGAAYRLPYLPDQGKS